MVPGARSGPGGASSPLLVLPSRWGRQLEMSSTRRGRGCACVPTGLQAPGSHRWLQGWGWHRGLVPVQGLVPWGGTGKGGQGLLSRHWDPILIGVALQQPWAGPRCAHLPLWGQDQPHPTSPELLKPGTAWGCRGEPGCATERVGGDRAQWGDLRLRLSGLPSPAPALPLWDPLLPRAAPGP